MKKSAEVRKLRRNNHRAQATLEIAIFGSLLLIVIIALLNYTRNLREQQLLDQHVFRNALSTAHHHNFTYTLGGETETAQGASVSYSKTIDKQSGLLFEPARRSLSSSYSVYWSSAQDAPELDYTYINADILSSPDTLPNLKKTLYLPRSNTATEMPDKEKINITRELIVHLYPEFQILLLGPGAAKLFGFKDWWGKWGGLFTRAASFSYFVYKTHELMQKCKDMEDEIKRLKAQDEKMGDWGWRIASEDKDGTDKAGKYYVKEVSPQVWDTQSASSTTYNYEEKKEEIPLQIINKRKIKLVDTISRTFRRHYDVTMPNLAISPSELLPENHTYEDLANVTLNQSLGSAGEYSKSNWDTGTEVTKDQKWTTAK